MKKRQAAKKARKRGTKMEYSELSATQIPSTWVGGCCRFLNIPSSPPHFSPSPLLLPPPPPFSGAVKIAVIQCLLSFGPRFLGIYHCVFPPLLILWILSNLFHSLYFFDFLFICCDSPILPFQFCWRNLLPNANLNSSVLYFLPDYFGRI